MDVEDGEIVESDEEELPKDVPDSIEVSTVFHQFNYIRHHVYDWPLVQHY